MTNPVDTVTPTLSIYRPSKEQVIRTGPYGYSSDEVHVMIVCRFLLLVYQATTSVVIWEFSIYRLESGRGTCYYRSSLKKKLDASNYESLRGGHTVFGKFYTNFGIAAAAQPSEAVINDSHKCGL